jgi:hypothetical protein
MDEQQQKLSKEREKMMSEGTKPSDVKAVEAVSLPSGDTGKSPPGSERAVPKGITLVEEPRIASEQGRLVIEPREVSTGGTKHTESEPKSHTPSTPSTTAS